jgi:hypothetical protein
MYWGRVVAIIYLSGLLGWAGVYIASGLESFSVVQNLNENGSPLAGTIAGAADPIAMGLLFMLLSAHPAACLLGNVRTETNENGKVGEPRNVLIAHRLQLLVGANFFLFDFIWSMVTMSNLPYGDEFNLMVGQGILDMVLLLGTVLLIIAFKAAPRQLVPPEASARPIFAIVLFVSAILAMCVLIAELCFASIVFSEFSQPLLLQQGGEWFIVSVSFLMFSRYMWTRQASGVFHGGHFVVSLLVPIFAFPFLLSEIVTAAIDAFQYEQTSGAGIGIFLVRMLTASGLGILALFCLGSIVFLSITFRRRIKPASPSIRRLSNKAMETDSLLSSAAAIGYVPPMHPPQYQDLHVHGSGPSPSPPPPTFSYPSSARSIQGDFEYEKPAN